MRGGGEEGATGGGGGQGGGGDASEGSGEEVAALKGTSSRGVAVERTRGNAGAASGGGRPREVRDDRGSRVWHLAHHGPDDLELDWAVVVGVSNGLSDL